MRRLISGLRRSVLTFAALSNVLIRKTCSSGSQ
jgi:hypothetical protein